MFTTNLHFVPLIQKFQFGTKPQAALLEMFAILVYKSILNLFNWIFIRSGITKKL